MKTATITEAKNGLSALIDRVRAGESVLILDRGVPVASLEPVRTTGEGVERLRSLERAGVVRLALAAPPVEVARTPPPPLRSGASAAEALLEERREGR